MSYILDALKKAERERDIAQIPTLTTVHDLPAEQSHRHVWMILAACLAGSALLAWIGFLLVKPNANPAATAHKIESTTEQADAVPTPVFEREREEIIPHRAAEAKGPPTIPSGRNPATEPKHAAPVASQTEKQPPTLSPAPKESIQPQPPTRVLTPGTAEAPTAPATPLSNPPSLREAVSKMNMTILAYAEVASERMVFINDRRYAEGDYVDGLYLVESITPEGAWLSFQGERAILRAKSR